MQHIQNPGIFNLWSNTKPCQWSMMKRHIENLDIARAVYSGIFQAYSEHSAISIHVQAYSARVRHIEAFSCIFMDHWGILSHIQTYSELCVSLPYTNVPYLKPEASLKDTCQTCNMIRPIQIPGIVRTIYSRIFKDL